jgi:hypothetical protein
VQKKCRKGCRQSWAMLNRFGMRKMTALLIAKG